MGKQKQESHQKSTKQLEKLLTEKLVEVDGLKRELEIEAALERVRALSQKGMEGN